MDKFYITTTLPYVNAQPHAGLLGDQPCLGDVTETPEPAPAALLPRQGELRVTVLAAHRVNADSRGTAADFHDAAATFPFAGHRTRL